MRDNEGNALKNSHLLGFFRRICKLLYYGIKPVFVFDGGAPSLKRKTLRDRQRRRAGADENVQRTAGKLLANRMHAHAIKEATLSQKAPVDPNTGRVLQQDISEDALYLADIDASMKMAKKRKYRDDYDLPPVDLSTRSVRKEDPRLATEEELKAFIDEIRESCHLPEDFDMDSDFFKSLPTDIQYEIIGDLRLKSRQSSWKRLEQMIRQATTAYDFSQAQILHLVQRNDLTQKLLNVTNYISKSSSDNLTSIIPARVVGERSREYVLIKNEDVEGGWKLGIMNGGTKQNPVDVDSCNNDVRKAHSISSSDDSEDADFIEVSIPNEEGEMKSLIPEDKEELAEKTLTSISKSPANDASRFAIREMLDEVLWQDAEPLSIGIQSNDKANFNELAAFQGQNLAKSEMEKMWNECRPVRFPQLFPELVPIFGHAFSIDHSELQREIISASRRLEKTADVDSERKICLTWWSQYLFAIEEWRKKNAGDVRRKYETDEVHISDDVFVFKDSQGLEHEMQQNEGMDGPIFIEENVQHEEGSLDICRPANWSPGKIDRDHLLVSPISEGPKQYGHQILKFDRAKLGSSPRVSKLPGDKPSESTPKTFDSEVLSLKGKGPVGTLVYGSELSDNDPIGPIKDRKKYRNVLNDLSSFTTDIEKSASSPFLSSRGIRKRTSDAASSPFVESQQSRIQENIASGDNLVNACQDIQMVQDLILHTDDSRSNVYSPTDDVFSDSEQKTKLSAGLSDSSCHPEHIVLADQDQGTMETYLTEPQVEEEESLQINTERQEFARFVSQVSNKNLTVVEKELRDELKQLSKQFRKQKGQADDVTVQMSKDCQNLLRLFGIPYVVAPMEAEAQCAELERLDLVDGIVTDDSDAFLFGAKRVYKNMFNQQKYVECFLASDIKRELELDQQRMIQLAFLLGSDYTEGLSGIGAVTAMEILGEFSSERQYEQNGPREEVDLSALRKFKEWWLKVQTGMDKPGDSDTPFKRNFIKNNRGKIFLESNFPDYDVVHAYTHPRVDDSQTEIQWGVPDLDGLREYLMDSFTWSQEKIDETLIPIIKHHNQRKFAGIQSKLDTYQFFDKSSGSAPRQKSKHKSARLNKVVKVLKDKKRGDFDLEEKE